MTRTLTFIINDKKYIACVDDNTMEIKNLKRNQAVEALDDEVFWFVWFELENHHQLEVRFERIDWERTFNPLGAVEFNEEGVIINDYEIEMTIK